MGKEEDLKKASYLHQQANNVNIWERTERAPTPEGFFYVKTKTCIVQYICTQLLPHAYMSLNFEQHRESLAVLALMVLSLDAHTINFQLRDTHEKGFAQLSQN
jgi:hypothetical protein